MRTAIANMAAEAGALAERGEAEAAAQVYRRLVAFAPNHPTLRHNLASLLCDAGLFLEGEAEARRAMGGGLDAPEAWVVLAHALQGQGRYPEAEEAYGRALSRNPRFATAHRGLADLIWMSTGDLSRALAPLDAAIAAHPGDIALIPLKAQVMEAGGRTEEAYVLLAEAAARSGDPWLEVAAAQAALSAAPTAALSHAERAVARGLTHATARITLCEAKLAVGQADEAAAVAASILRDDPLDQRALCLQGVAWRLLGDPRHMALFDYRRLVRSYTLDTPEGWPDLDAFLADLTHELLELNTLHAHPVGQSIRGGAQTQQSLSRAKSPALQAFFRGLDRPIRAYLLAVREAGAPLRWKQPFDYRITGAWSVLLKPGGRHVSHMHPSGRISSAFHVETPAPAGEGEEGALVFGEPDVPTSPALAAEHRVRPQPGRLVLFPSFLPHGTVPITRGRRLTLAFDIVPLP